MEKDTVILSLEDYNELKGIKDAVEKGERIFFTSGWLGDKPVEFLFANESETEFVFVNEIERLRKNNRKLDERIEELENPKKQEPTIEDIKKFNWLQFRKWKNQMVTC